MDFRDLSRFFGGCILPEDIRVDLVKCHRDLPRWTAEDSPTTELGLLLQHIVFHSLSGDLRMAFELLGTLESKATAAKDRDLLVRVPVYRLHLQRIERAPPPLDFWSDRSTEQGTLDDARIGRGDFAEFHRFLGKVEDKVNQHFKNFDLPKIQVLEPQTLLKLWPMVHYTWNGSYLHHPDFKSKLPELTRQIRSDGIGEFSPTEIGNAKWRGIEETAFMMELLNAKKKTASGKRTRYLDLHSEVAEELGSRTRKALCLVMIGDFRLSNPFTSPLALNLMLYAAGPGWNDEQWDSMEHDILCTQSAENEALKAYKTSFDLFKAEACSRGVAAVHLRCGCIFMMKAIDSLVSKSTTTVCKDLISEAMIEFDEAEPLFELDATHLCIIDALRLLGKIVREENLNVKHLADAAERIGRWGAEKGNPRPSRFSGMLLLRAGRRLARGHFVDRAWKCCVCAQIAFAALRDPTLEAKVVEAQTLYYQKIGHTKLPRKHLQYNKNVFGAAFKHVEGVIELCSSEPHRQKMREFQKKRYVTFLKLGNDIFKTNHELQSWQSYIRSIYTKSPVVAQKRPEGKFVDNLSNTLELMDPYLQQFNTSDLLKELLGGEVSETSLDHLEHQLEQPDMPVEFADKLPKEKSIDDSLTRLEHFIQLLSISNDWRKAKSQALTNEMRRDWKIHNDAVRARNSIQADKALDVATTKVPELSKSSGLSGPPGILQSAGLPNDDLRSAILSCYQGHFDEARKILSTLSPIGFPQFGAAVHDMGIPEPDFTSAADRIGHLQLSVHLQLCYVSRDWSKGRDILVDLGSKRTRVLNSLKNSSDTGRWMTMVALGYIRLRTSPDLLDEALQYYREAYHVVLEDRLNLIDIQDRRAGGSLISPVDVYQGLARIGLELHAKKQKTTLFRTFGRNLLDIHPRSSQIHLENIDLAVLFLEQGRASVLADMLLLHVDNNRSEWLKLQVCIADMDKTMSHVQLNESDPNQTISEIIQRALQDQPILQLGIRARKAISLRDWVQADKIYHQIPDDTIVIHVNTDLEQTNILYLTDQGVQLHHQAAFTAYDLNTTVLHFLDRFRPGDSLVKKNLQDWLPRHEEYDHVIEKLSKHILQPATALLKRMRTVIFVPSKLLHDFPLSVLTFQGVPLCESKTVYTCPSLQVFSILARRCARRAPERDAKLSSSGLVTFMATRKFITSNKALDVAAAFAITTSTKFQFKAVPADAIDRKLLLDEMKSSRFVQISSHGRFGKDSPWDTSLSFGSSFSVREMLGNTTTTDIIFLQACFSSTSGPDDGDDVIGFSHAVLSAGANSFIGALWAVNELASSLLTSIFFEYCKSADSSMTLADALREAQMKLRRMKRAEVVERLSMVQKKTRQMVAENDFAEHRVNTKTLARRIGDEIEVMKNKAECPFDHPYFWAPFVLVGYGHQKCTQMDNDVIEGS